jgi:phosphoribosylanthranilate isomerase
MSSNIRIKICGLRTAADVVAATDAGATYIGFNFFPKSPRYVSLDQARDLAIDVPIGVAKVGLVVNADDAMLDALTDKVPLDMIQLHGSETSERVAEIRTRYGLPVIKVLGVSGPDDLDAIDRYSVVADQLMLDAKPPKDAVLPGGNGVSFDWALLS